MYMEPIDGVHNIPKQRWKLVRPSLWKRRVMPLPYLRIDMNWATQADVSMHFPRRTRSLIHAFPDDLTEMLHL